MYDNWYRYLQIAILLHVCGFEPNNTRPFAFERQHPTWV